jgi:hypothetical protein
MQTSSAFFELLISGLTLFSLLESELGFEIVRLATRGHKKKPSSQRLRDL